MKLFNSDSTHWYQRDGAPMHTVPSAKDGTPRPTTLRDARKLNLMPSVTNILGVIAKPELINWLQEQAVLAALTLPRIAGESEDEFARRVVEDSHNTRDKAADFGTAFHAGAEQIANGQPVDADNVAAAWLELYRPWFAANCVKLHWTELQLPHSAWGYAGTADLLMDHQEHGTVLVDLKTMKVRAGEKAKPYKSWCYQLAAYRRALGKPVHCMNLIINSVEPSAPVEHVWTEAELDEGWQAFISAHRLWSIEKQYNPAELLVKP